MIAAGIMVVIGCMSASCSPSANARGTGVALTVAGIATAFYVAAGGILWR